MREHTTEQYPRVTLSSAYSQLAVPLDIVLRCACALFLSAYNRMYVLGLCVYHHYSPKLPSIPFICLFILLFSHLATHSICVLAINLSKADFFRIRIAQITLSRCTHTHTNTIDVYWYALKALWLPLFLFHLVGLCFIVQLVRMRN